MIKTPHGVHDPGMGAELMAAFYEIATILADKALSLSDAAFLIEIGRRDEAAAYLLGRAEQLNGDFYGSLHSLA